MTNTNCNEHEMPVFYYCPFCGNLVEVIHGSGNPMICCGEEMQQLGVGTTDGKTEYHVPVCTIEDRTVSVSVGAEPHPMLENHHINWIELVTDRGIYRKCVSHKEKAHACFRLGKTEQIRAIFAYCNIHGLWATYCMK